jgi:hypothetical protein
MRSLIAAAIVTLLVLGLAAPATATSCVAAPGATPVNMLTGRPVQGAPLFERFDLAVVGTVTAIQTNEAAGGATRTTVDVHAGFNVDAVPQTLAVSSSDPGWMNGYAFEHERTYFIPLQHPGPQGEPHYSMVCDPITPLDGPDAAAELTRVAADNGVTVAEIETAPPAPTAARGPSLASLVAIAVAAVLALGAVLLLAVAATRRRRPA